MDIVINPNQGDNHFNNILKPFSNPWAIGIVIVIGVIFTAIVGNLGSAGSDQVGETNSTSTLEILLWALFAFLIITIGVKQAFGIEYAASIRNLLSDKPEVDLELSSINKDGEKPIEVQDTREVFNITGNHYSYENAKAICKAYDAKLATYEQLEDAYKDGAEWCSYGWSFGQNAYFPTQKETYNKLQDIKGHEHDCGRQGINGGYIANPNVKYGVNCFGYKPKSTPGSEELMSKNKIYPKTRKDIRLDKRVDYWKDRLDKILVSPFNHDTWSKV